MARERRTQINHTLSELNELLCPGQERLDKLTVVRLATATIKLHEFLRGIDSPQRIILGRDKWRNINREITLSLWARYLRVLDNGKIAVE